MHLIFWEQDHVLILFKKKQLYVQSCTVYETIYHYQKLSKPNSLQRASWNVINLLSFLVQNRQVFPKDLQTKNAKKAECRPYATETKGSKKNLSKKHTMAPEGANNNLGPRRKKKTCPATSKP